MKKIILLPLMVLPLLTGCNNTQKAPLFSLNEWLTNIDQKDPTYFEADIYDKTTRNPYSDVDFKIAEIIKENTKSMSLKKCAPITEIREETKSYPIRYIIDRKMDDFVRLEVRIDEENLFMWAVGYDENKTYLSEITEYTLPKEDGKKLIQEVDKRWAEVDKIANESYDRVWKETTPETFYAFIEESTTEPSVIYKEKETKDTNHSLLDDIKGFTYIEIDYIFDLDKHDDVVFYGLEDDYMMAIGTVSNGNNSQSLVQLIKYYDNPACHADYEYISECRRTYSVSGEKIKAFMDKAKAL